MNRNFSLLLVFGLLVFSACSSKPLSEETVKKVDRVAVASFLGNEFHVDVLDRSLVRSKDVAMDVTDWSVDEALERAVADSIRDRGRDSIALPMDPLAVSSALGSGNTKWKRFLGKSNHELYNLLFKEAKEVGSKYLFVVVPEDRQKDFPFHRGPMGVLCFNRKLRKTEASPYFLFHALLFEVEGRKKLFETTMNPDVTANLRFAECSALARMKDPKKELEGPVKQALGLVVEGIFQKMGWKKQ